jgi:class 3 adenylate cyclase/tetratricopeptide (TPR) repeat protein
LAAACPACGFTNEPGDEFCGGCGARLGGPQPSQPRFTSPDAYTPKHLAEKILLSKTALEGERKQVTVLFADLKGSMELLADRDPEEARKLLDPVLERMMEAVHRYEGTVNQVMGDGIMALFGAPVAHEDHAVRACYAALDMQAAVGRYAEDVRRTRGIGGIRIRVGLNSGEVVVRAIGSDLHIDYTAVGQTTHLAARMEQLADPGTTVLTADTLRLAEGWIEVRPLGPVPVKGLEAPFDAYEMVRAGPRRSRFHAAAVRGLTKFVGRDTELEQLREAFARAAAGHGQVVAIVGEPGVGKSRLVWEVTHSHRTHGWLVLHAGSVSYGKATPYQPILDLLRNYFEIEDRDDTRRVREKVTGKLLTLDRELESSLTAFLALLDVPLDNDAGWQALDPSQRRRRILEAVKRLVLRESQVQPLLLVFEDLHWIDSETQAWLDSVIEAVSGARLMLLVNYRPEYQHTWGSRTSYTQLRLDRLPPESAEQLLDALLGTDASLAPVTGVLIARTEGNPFFLEESVRTLVETGSLVGERGAYRLARPLPTIQVPATVQAVVAARLDRLSPGDKALLQTASVIGKDVPIALLQATAALTEDELHSTIGRLQTAEFLYEAGIFPDLEYSFKHALTHDVTYGSLLQDRRRALHRQILETIERLYADRLTEHVERLAHHAFRAEAWDRAVTYSGQAGTKAYARSAWREAVTYLEQALTAITQLRDTAGTRAQGFDVRLALSDPLVLLGQVEKALLNLRDAEHLAQGLDPIRQAWAAARLASHFWLTDRATEAWSSAERAHALAEAHGDHTLRVATTYLLGTAAMAGGDHRRAVEFFRETLARIGAGEQGERFGLIGFPGALAHAYLAHELAQVGEFTEAIAEGGVALRVATLLDHPNTRVVAEWRIAYIFILKGDLARAMPLGASAVARARHWEITLQIIMAASVHGLALVLSDRAPEGLALLDEALEAMAALGDRTHLDLEAASQIAEGYLAADRLDVARATAEAVRTRAHAQGKRDREAQVLHMLGEVARREGDHRLAGNSLGMALALASELRMRPLVAHCHLGLGKLYRQTGNRAKAAEHLTTTTTMYREMDMGFWLEKAEAELGRAL